MDLHATLVRTCIGPLWARWERSPYLRHYRHYRRTQYDAPEVIRRRQSDAVAGLLRHAFETSPFWRDRLEDADLEPGSFQTLDDLARLPVLTKDDLRQHGEAMRSAAFADAPLHRKSTSGSTGVSVVVYVDEAAQQRKRGLTLRSDEWSGWRFGERVAKVWGNPEYLKRGWRGRLRNGLLDRATYLDTLKMTGSHIDAFLAELRRRPPSLLFGHAHSLYLVAEYVRQRGPAGFRPRGIISTAMVLHDWERACIEKAFGCPVTNRYGCEEVSLIACECESHNGLHVNADGVFVEILRPDGSHAEPGEPGAVVVTDLLNHAMPMIRYQVGDMAVASERTCRCGRGLPLLERIEGRAADYVCTADGELVSGISLTENFAMQVPGIKQIQIVQETVEFFHFRIVRGPDFGEESLRRMGELVRQRFGPPASFRCEFLERIPQEPSGKYRFCISRVPNPYLQPVGAEV